MNERVHARHVEMDTRVHYTVHYAVVELGTVTLEVCDKCSYIRAVCLHTKNTWHGEPTAEGDLDGGSQTLLCDLCKIDGT